MSDDEIFPRGVNVAGTEEAMEHADVTAQDVIMAATEGDEAGVTTGLLFLRMYLDTILNGGWDDRWETKDEPQ